MDEKEDKPFKEETIGTKLFIIVTISLLLIGAIGFAIAIYYFGILGLFNLLGVSYDSFGSLLWFVLLYFLLGIIFEIFLKGLHKLMILANKFSKSQLKMGIFILTFLSNWAVISLLNSLMHTIEINTLTQIVISIILAIIEVTIDDDSKKNSSD
ncbi:YrvL family regulatory protein [Bacillus yapensis]|nr:YrvL family regulatory protein [Bacillus yapensis]